MASLPAPRRTQSPSKRAALYLRVSTDEQEDNSSLESQRAACEQLAATLGYTVSAIYSDIESGANPERPQFHAMCDALRARQLDAVICWKRDRLARDAHAIGHVYFEAERVGARVEIVVNPRGNTPDDHLLNAIEDGQAMRERRDIALRTQGGMRGRVMSAKHYLPGPRAPYGYTWLDPYPTAENPKGPTKTKLVTDPITGPIVQRMFDHVAGGGSARSLELALTAEHVQTPTEYAKGLPASKPWLSVSIRLILRNPVYKGQPQAYRWKLARPDLAKVEVPLEKITEPFALPAGVAPALVSPEVWQRANEQLDRNQQMATRRNTDPESTLLRAGFAVCGYCGHPLASNAHRDGRQYRCSPSNRRRYGCLDSGIAAAKLDAAVWGKVLDVLSDPSYVRQYMQSWLAAEDTTGVQLERVTAELAAIEVKERRLTGHLAQLDDAGPTIKMLNDLGARKRQLTLEQNTLSMRRGTYLSTLARWDGMLTRWDWQGWAHHPRIAEMSYAERRFWLTNLNVKAEVWRRDGGPDGQQYRITMAIDESFWLPTEAELTGAEPELPQGVPTSIYRVSAPSTVDTSSSGCGGRRA